MRLRPLTEAECYARCYGRAGVDRISYEGRLPALPALPPELLAQTRRPLPSVDEWFPPGPPEAEAA